MLYLNTLIGFIGFAVGYLPFTLYYKQHTTFLKDSIPAYLKDNQIFTWPDLVAYWVTGKSDFVAHSEFVKGNIDFSQFRHVHGIALVVALIRFLLILAILARTFRVGKKYLATDKLQPNEGDIVMLNTEDLHMKLTGEDGQKVCG